MSEAIAQTSETTDVPPESSTPSVVVIEAQNPSSDEMKGLLENIRVNFDFSVNTREVAFNFKKSVDKKSGIETVRNAVNLALPYPSVEGIIAILEGSADEEGNKGLELLLGAMEDVVNSQARSMLADNLELNAATFPVDSVSWEFIANLPKAQRRGGGIPKETWEEFTEDYIAVMVEATGKSVDQVTNAAKILKGKLQAVKTAVPVLTLLVEQLGVYLTSSPNSEDFAECVEFLLSKAETFLSVTDEDLLANL
jgi:hypothetical protein